MTAFDTMNRWVQRDGKRVTFGNIVGAFVGKEYRYECDTEEHAEEFEAYVNQRDPENPKLPVPVGKEIASRFGAVEIMQEGQKNS